MKSGYTLSEYNDGTLRVTYWRTEPRRFWFPKTVRTTWPGRYTDLVDAEKAIMAHALSRTSDELVGECRYTSAGRRIIDTWR